MKNKLIVIMVLALTAGTLLAGGDKVRGDKGKGSVHQHQVQPPWWATVLSLFSW